MVTLEFKIEYLEEALDYFSSRSQDLNSLKSFWILFCSYMKYFEVAPIDYLEPLDDYSGSGNFKANIQCFLEEVSEESVLEFLEDFEIIDYLGDSRLSDLAWGWENIEILFDEMLKESPTEFQEWLRPF